MKINTQSPLKVLLLSFILIFHFSCSKDSDLLTDYVLRNTQEVVNGSYVVNDTFIMVSLKGSIVLDVLKNDRFNKKDKVKIKKTSSATNGEVIINDDNTITYTPDSVEETPVTAEEPPVTDAEIVDMFTYTIEVVNEDQSVTTEDGTVTIVITPETDNFTNCVTNGGLAGDTGLKTWCWEGIILPEYSDKKGVSFSNQELKIDSECYEKQVTKSGNQLKFSIDPTSPDVESWCSRDFNMRAEIRTAPWNVRHAKGTEEWFGWSYTFGKDYIIDQNNQWLFFQVHPGIVGESPHTELMISNKDQYSGHDAGEIYVVNKGNYPDNHATGITPIAGETIDIVVHAIWDDSSNGLLQVWINGNSVYDKQVATIYSDYPWGGNAKWGIYKWPWANADGVQKSLDQGITYLQTFMGPLRMITRRPGDADYRKDSYSLVAPD